MGQVVQRPSASALARSALWEAPPTRFRSCDCGSVAPPGPREILPQWPPAALWPRRATACILYQSMRLAAQRKRAEIATAESGKCSLTFHDAFRCERPQCLYWRSLCFALRHRINLYYTDFFGPQPFDELWGGRVKAIKMIHGRSYSKAERRKIPMGR